MKRYYNMNNRINKNLIIKQKYKIRNYNRTKNNAAVLHARDIGVPERFP